MKPISGWQPGPGRVVCIHGMAHAWHDIRTPWHIHMHMHGNTSFSLSMCFGRLDVVVEHALHGEGEDAELGEGQHERRDQETALMHTYMTRVRSMY